MNTQTMDITKIRPYEKNPRRNDASVAAIMESIKQFGFNQPIVVDSEMVIIAGHARFKAARKLGLKQVPVFIASHLTKEQATAYRLADNKVGENSKWDSKLFDLEMKSLPDFDFSKFGFAANITEPQNLDEMLEVMNPSETVAEPIWITIRASMDDKEFLEEVMSRITRKGCYIERSYESMGIR